MKLSIAGRTFALPEDVTVTVERDERGQPVVIIEDGDSGIGPTYEASTGPYPPESPAYEGMSLYGIISARNAILDDIPECTCDECSAEREDQAKMDAVIDDTRMAILSEIGDMLDDQDLWEIASERMIGRDVVLKLAITAGED